jgi:type VI secretion system protein ImpB
MSDIENGQHWVSRNRPPRVQITYDLEIGDAVKKTELPLVVGVLANLDLQEGKVVLEQKFEAIDRDNFNQVMEDIAPGITINLPASALQDGGPAGEAKLTFKTIDDFSPLGVIDQVDELRTLFAERKHLRDMLAKLDGNVKLEQELARVMRGDASKPAPGAN